MKNAAIAWPIAVRIEKRRRVAALAEQQPGEDDQVLRPLRRTQRHQQADAPPGAAGADVSSGADRPQVPS